MNDVTRLMQAIGEGDQAASEQLLPLVYDELRRLAKMKMGQEPSGQTLQPTALVHEAYIRLVDATHPQTWNSRGHFFAAAAECMRRILIENARRKQSLRRGGERRRLDLDKVDLTDPNDCDFLTALDRSLVLLASEKPEAAQVVNLRFFCGMSIQQVADAMSLSVRTVNRHWAFAKTWIYRQLSSDDPGGCSFF